MRNFCFLQPLPPIGNFPQILRICFLLLPLPKLFVYVNFDNEDWSLVPNFFLLMNYENFPHNHKRKQTYTKHTVILHNMSPGTASCKAVLTYHSHRNILAYITPAGLGGTCSTVSTMLDLCKIFAGILWYVLCSPAKRWAGPDRDIYHIILGNTHLLTHSPNIITNLIRKHIK